MTDTGLTRVDGVVVLSGPALRAARDCALIAAKHRKMSGVPYRTYEALACELNEAMSASGQADMRSPAISKAVAVDQPTVPITEAAARLGVSDRHARRLAERLGGQKIGSCWLVDETALAQHLEGKQ
ncbi:helix-turn-helix domain-containing protein [Mycolicibacterium gilvum]|uniref:helix-turn-helix domain-containing protein n=1 Tax=Mycolicibacterium gilvum TaxID=1804 RepID=UPI0040455572